MYPKPHSLALALSGALALSSLSWIAAPATAGGMAPAVPPAAGAGADAASTKRYLILLREPALASYRGDTAQFASPPRIVGAARKGRLDAKSSVARQYVQHLAERQSVVVSDITRQIGRPMATSLRLQHALNGLVADLTPAEAAAIAARADVARVEEDTQVPFNAEPGPSFIGADTIWDGSASGGLATQGEGIVIGLIDSGINWQSPSFAAVDPGDGYQHINPLGAGQYLGGCAASAPNPDLGHCNDKLIGIYNLFNPAASATDTNGHGTHTASTAGGNHRNVSIGGGDFAIAGIAPRANIVMFSCLTPSGGCGSVAAAASVDRAVADGVVDVLNFSVAGGTAPWSDMVSLAFLGATEAGIFVAAAAGNDGPDPQSINHIEPWVTTAAASTLDYTTGFDFSLDLPGGAPGNTQHIGVHPGGEPHQTSDLTGLPIALSPSFDNTTHDGCSAFAPGLFTGAIAVMRLHTMTSGCSSVQRQSNAVNAGAVGVLFVDADTYVPMGATGSVWSMLLADWENVWAAIQTNPAAATVSIKFPLSLYPDDGDHIADFSSRGPNIASQSGGQLLFKPDISAPGVAILAATAGDPDAIEYLNGTSMAAPHIAGAGALLRAVHPDWTPLEIKSALMTTAWTTDIVTQFGGPTTPWDRGAGRVDLTTAVRAGLLLDETAANLRAANPAQGGVLRSLNLANAVMGSCGADTCQFTRRLRNPLPVSVGWNTSLVGLPHASVSPSTFTVAPGATQEVNVRINPASLPGSWTFAELRLIPDVAGVSDASLPIAVKRNSAVPMLLLASTQLSATLQAGGTTTRPLTLSNAGTGAIHWSIDTTSPGCERPGWASYSPTSGTLLSGGAARTLTTTFNAQGVGPGTHAATLCIASDDPDLPLARVDLQLEVLGADMIFANGFDH